MAVSPAMRGKNIGWLLGMAIIEKARSLGAKNIYLESNTKLVPAISLYHKLGFEKVVSRASPYKRSNIQMAMNL
jgi:ribosomal protein S18 acetylase RimI-like enzyme